MTFPPTPRTLNTRETTAVSFDPLAHFLRQLSPENRAWLESRPAEDQRAIAEEWRSREGGASARLSSTDLLPDLIDEGASANAYLREVRSTEAW
ncbi:hypothetical protein RM780_27335 [Streptomyces sp. DSM 44917]|uniref:Uncharacterized protein n=1 Tax=Streptomyces boetiae TaxID=3075541 RepID=A0ABU2LGF3_9ACTN|nr:hypothetical protein [Streptomyces sp. DSM 44917]MDT0310632.1 hypothetical protein [Streptomyces sp. DSM 44917]